MGVEDHDGDSAMGRYHVPQNVFLVRKGFVDYCQITKVLYNVKPVISQYMAVGY